MLDPYRFGVAGGFDTLLLLHGDGTNGAAVFTDSSSYARTATVVGGVTTATDAAAFGGSSILFASGGTPNYVEFTSAGFLSSTTVDFTIECWVDIANIVSGGDGYADGRYSFLRLTEAGVKKIEMSAISATQLLLAIPTAFPHTVASSLTRTHMAVVRSAGSISAYVGGVYVNAAAANFNIDKVQIGNVVVGGTSRTAGGNVEEIRLSAGARYTAAFTPPASAFVDD